jgi:hypothetical protein
MSLARGTFKIGVGFIATYIAVWTIFPKLTTAVNNRYARSRVYVLKSRMHTAPLLSQPRPDLCGGRLGQMMMMFLPPASAASDACTLSDAYTYTCSLVCS